MTIGTPAQWDIRTITKGNTMTGRQTDRQNKIRLLLVDDEKGFADILAKRLKRRNISTVTAYSSSEGIQELMKSQFDVAVVDLKMEGMDGIGLLEVFKKMYPALPVIMLTGHGSEEASRQGKALGAYDYLSKPYELDKLISKIESAAGFGGNSHG